MNSLYSTLTHFQEYLNIVSLSSCFPIPFISIDSNNKKQLDSTLLVNKGPLCLSDFMKPMHSNINVFNLLFFIYLFIIIIVFFIRESLLHFQKV